MSIFLMVLTCLNIILVLGLSFSVFLRVKEKKEDQRITKGLQLLQHKISILQDLSDKTDEQIQRQVFMLDSKSNELRRLTLEASQTVQAAQEVLQNTSKEMPQVLSTTALSAAPMDELSQFVQALSQQNEKIKPTSISTATSAAHTNLATTPMPQDFMDTEANEAAASPAPITTTSHLNTPSPAVKLFQFKKI